jgi:hypothetical protein
MKGPNEGGREDSKNAISDDLETQNFRSRPTPSPLKFIKLPTYTLEAQHYIFLALHILLWKVFFIGRLQLAYLKRWKEKWLLVCLLTCFQMSNTTKFHGIFIFIHWRSRSSCWLCYNNLTQNVVECSRNKDQPCHSYTGP